MIFFEQPYTIFTIVGLVILALSLLEIFVFFFGFSFSKVFDINTDIDADVEIDSNVDLDFTPISNISLFHLGEVPFSFVLMLVGLVFSFSGISIHYFLNNIGFSISNLAVVPFSIFISCVLGFYLTRLFAKILPNNESYALSLTELLGSDGVVVIGEGNYNRFVQIKVVDKYGYDHYLMSKAAIEGQDFRKGDKIVLIENYADGTFGSIIKDYGDNNYETQLG